VLDRAAVLVAAGVLTGWVFAAIDVWRRVPGHRVPLAPHSEAVLSLYALMGAGAGLIALGLTSLDGWCARRLEKRPKLWVGIRATVYGGAAASIGASTAFWMFTGGRARTLPVASWGPWAAIAGIAAGAAVLALLATWVRRRAEKKAPWLALSALVPVVAASALLIWADLHVLVALYARLHTFLEASAAIGLFVVFAVLLDLAVRRWSRARAALSVVAATSMLWLAVFIVFDAPKVWVGRTLKYAWREPVYAGRMLARAKVLEAFLRNPSHWRSASESGLDRLRESYDIGTTSLSSVWEDGPVEPKEFAKKLKEAHERTPGLNIVVFYVDTLRQDVARDPQVMPALDGLAKESLDFRHAYTTGSDTMNALPALTSGRYVTAKPGPGDLLEVAKRAKLKTVLVIPQSAHEFLRKERPVFQFDETVHVTDFTPARTDVWGYGADRSSATELADHAVDWMRQHKDERFLLWSFNFDVHNWRELSDKHVTETALRFGMPQGKGMARYRIAARGVDEGLSRLLRGIDQLGLRDKTIVLFVSDHGEGVGRDGFWVHAIFLWEALVRIPMVMRIPGVTPRPIEQEVSLVDVAPTLGRYIDPDIDVRSYQGIDLIGLTLNLKRPKRRPLVMVGAAQDGLRRIGLVEPGNPMKLVLQIESGVPELYDRNAPDPDWDDLSEKYDRVSLEMLASLVRSPVYPRKPEPPDPADGKEVATGPH
jgi:hypothetical protein